MGKLFLIQKLHKLWKYFKFGSNSFVYDFSKVFFRRNKLSK